MNNTDALIINQNQEDTIYYEGLFKVVNSLKAIAIFQMIVWHCYVYINFSKLIDHSNTIIRSIIEIGDLDMSDFKKCPICSKTKRKLYDYDGKELCEDCLMIKILYDDIIKFKNELDLDTFARLNSFYTYKGGAAHYRTFFQILMNDQGNI